MHGVCFANTKREQKFFSMTRARTVDQILDPHRHNVAISAPNGKSIVRQKSVSRATQFGDGGSKEIRACAWHQ